MRILILNWRCPKNPLSGGAERVTFEHAKAWVKKGEDITWLSGNYPHGKKFEIIDGVKIYRFGNPITIYCLTPFIYWFKFKGNFDLVIDEIHGLPFLTPFWAYKSKKLAYIHEVAQEIWGEMFPFPINILGQLYEKIYFFLYKNTPFLTGSNSTKEDLINYGINENNISVIPHGLFLKPVNKIPEKEKSLTLLYVSRLVKMKGIEEAIKIFVQVHEKILYAKFWIVGSGEESYVNKLHNFVKKFKINKSVIFFGYVDEKKKIELYQKAHFLLHTSVREGFGLVVIEANSQGTPVLAYDNPGLHDVVKNEVNGFLFYPQKGNLDLIKAIAKFNDSSQYKKLQTTSIEFSKQFNWQNITSISYNLIKSLTL